jgi:hypothetical protein
MTTMRLPWPRFTFRRLMILVAIVGLALGCEITRRRRETFLEKAQFFDDTASTCKDPNESESWMVLSRKHARAARYPWLPVGPDPPQPK